MMAGSPRSYVAFLRGINVGGHAVIRMSELQRAFEGLGFENVRTVLASGNVIFDPPGAIGRPSPGRSNPR